MVTKINSSYIRMEYRAACKRIRKDVKSAVVEKDFMLIPSGDNLTMQLIYRSEGNAINIWNVLL